MAAAAVEQQQRSAQRIRYPFDAGPGQGLTLVPIFAQLEPFLSLKPAEHHHKRHNVLTLR